MRYNWLEYEKAHFRNMALYSKRVQDAYNKAIDDIFLRINQVSLPEGKIFSLDDYPLFREHVDNIAKSLQSNINTVIANGVTESWNLSNLKNDNFVKMAVGNRELTKSLQDRFFNKNIPALNSFIDRKTKGFKLSDRIWDLNTQFRQEIDAGLQLGIGSGTPAARMATEMKQYLNNPDKLFRRVRDKDGVLRLSKAAKEYHPGRGKYRSSYRNALRLTRNEMNMAYRTADYERWQDMDFILGFEVKLSAMHPVYDICDEAAGFYPKNFKFTGWHTSCFCYAVPVTPGQKEFSNYIDSILDGKDYKFTGKITDVPQGFKNWITSHTDQIKNWSSVPYFIRDNFKGGDITQGLRISTITSATKKLPQDDLYKIIENKENVIRMNKDFETAVLYDDYGRVIFEKKGGKGSVGFNPSELAKFKDSILTHNHPRGWKFPENSIGRIGSSFSDADVMIAVNNNLKEIRAAGPLYTFIMKRPVKGWPDSRHMAKMIAQVGNDVFHSTLPFVTSGKVSRIHAEVMHWHSVWKKISKEFGIEYMKYKAI